MNPKASDMKNDRSPSELISDQIAGLPDWRGDLLACLRKLIHEAVPDINEEWKWGSAVWSKDGLVCSAGVFKDHIKLNFFKGAAIEDPYGLFNAGLDAKLTRAIDFHQGEDFNEHAIKDLIHRAVIYNTATG